MCPTDRYVVLWRGEPVYSAACAEDLITYLWGRQIRRAPDAPFDYTVLDYEVPHVVDTGDLCAWLARLPADGARAQRACVPLPRRERARRPGEEARHA